ncbi:hypothetical protein ACEV9B_24065, partial [Vibrio parahaemolyticus]
MRIPASLIATSLIALATPQAVVATPPAALTGEQEDMSKREDVNTSTGEQVDNATSEPVDTSTGGGDPFYCGERKLGTWFYCERP